jgi:hypothetical protein
MQKEVRSVTVTCDLCGHPTKDAWNSVSEGCPTGVISLTYDIWYGGIYDVKDTCRECQAKLSEFLRTNKMIGHGQKRIGQP